MIALEAFLRARALRLPCVEKSVLLVLSSYAHADGGGAFPTIATLAGDCGVTPRAVQKALARLLKARHVGLEDAGGQHRPRVYRVLLPGGRGERGSPLADGAGVNVVRAGGIVVRARGERGSPNGITKGSGSKRRAERAVYASIAEELGACPHRIRCATIRLCRNLQTLDAAVRAQEITPAAGASLASKWQRQARAELRPVRAEAAAGRRER